MKSMTATSVILKRETIPSQVNFLPIMSWSPLASDLILMVVFGKNSVIGVFSSCVCISTKTCLTVPTQQHYIPLWRRYQIRDITSMLICVNTTSEPLDTADNYRYMLLKQTPHKCLTKRTFDILCTSLFIYCPLLFTSSLCALSKMFSLTKVAIIRHSHVNLIL